MKGRPKGTTGTLHENGAPAMVVDVLSTEQRWLRFDVLTDLVQEAGKFKRSTVERAISRLTESGRIRARPLYHPEFGHHFEYFSDEWSAGAS